MNKYNVVMEMNDSTVVTEYEPVKRKSDSYQSEQALENEFIRMLTEQGYDYLEIHDSESLIKNLRTQLEIVNDYKFTDSEWDRFFNDSIANNNDGIVEKKPEEVNKEEEEEEEKHTAITLIDGSDRVMVSIGEKFEAKHTKDFTIEVKDEPEITIAMQDGFVFDGRIHFFVSLSEALAKHITLKDVTEITGPKGSYSGYEIKLEVTDKGDLESIDCTRSFNYKKVKDAVLIIQLSLE